MDKEILKKIDDNFVYKDSKLYRVYKGGRLREVINGANSDFKFEKTKFSIPKTVWYLNTGYYPDNKSFGYVDGNSNNYSFNNLVPLWDDGNTFTSKRLKQLFDYNPDTGALYRKVNMPGAKAGILKPNNDGYIGLRIFQKMYLAHHVIWKIMYDEDVPDGYVIDHINHDRTDNSIKNLRIISKADNARNMKRKINRELPMGIVKTDNNKFKAVIDKDGLRTYIGTYNTLKEAVAAWEATKKILGFHKNHGK